MNERKKWSKDEEILAFNLYCKIPFSQTVKTNQKVIELANLIGRTPSAVAMKLGNFGSFDPELKKRGVKGLTNTSTLDQQIWEEFSKNWDDLAFKSENILNFYKIEHNIDFTDFQLEKDREAIVKQRVNQSFFRQMVLSSYENKCCISNLSVTSLLEAAHILSYAEEITLRTNPHNGLCMSILYHKAYDSGVFSISPDYKFVVSKKFAKENAKDCEFCHLFLDRNQSKISLPHRFIPNRDYLERQYSSFLEKQN